MIRSLIHSISHLIYPALCANCKHTLQHQHYILCASCRELLELIDPKERCQRCFTDMTHHEICLRCRKNYHSIHKCAAVFEYEGPASLLIRQLKYSQQTYLAKGIAGFMLMQWGNLGWELPDIIVPAPQSTVRWLERGFNQSTLLAREIGKGLHVPVKEILKRKSGDFSQAGLRHGQRLKIKKSIYTKTKERELADKRILLIDDVLTTGATLRQCAEVLIEYGPKEICALTFCRAK
jgi:competence protein ComFC